jgi:hypothetical protein
MTNGSNIGGGGCDDSSSTKRRKLLNISWATYL